MRWEPNGSVPFARGAHNVVDDGHAIVQFYDPYYLSFIINFMIKFTFVIFFITLIQTHAVAHTKYL